MTIPAYIKYLEKHDPILLPFAMKVIKEDPNIKDVHHIDALAEMLYAESDSGKKINTADMIDDYLAALGITLEQLYAEEQKITSIAEQIVKNEEYDFLNTYVRADIFDVILAEADEPVTPRKIREDKLETVEQMNSIAKALATLESIDVELLSETNAILGLTVHNSELLLEKQSKLFAHLSTLADNIFVKIDPIDEIVLLGFGVNDMYKN